jgi:hypothetical protein
MKARHTADVEKIIDSICDNKVQQFAAGAYTRPLFGPT